MEMTMIFIFGILICFSIFFDKAKISTKKKNIIFYVFALSFSLLAAFRTQQIPDTTPYVDFYNYIAYFITKNNFFMLEGRFEIGFEFLTKFAALFHLGYQGLFFVIAMINMLLLKATFTNDKFMFIPLAACSYFSFYFSFIILRAGLAIMLFCYGALKGKNWWSRILIFILAFSFHKSVLLGIFAFYFITFVSKKCFSFNACLIMNILLFFVYYFGLFSFVLDPIVNILTTIDLDAAIIRRLVYYLDASAVVPFLISNRHVLTIILYLAASYIINQNEKLKNKKEIVLMDKMMFLGILIVSLFGSGVLSGRFSDMLFIFGVGFVPVIAEYYTSTKNKNRVSINGGFKMISPIRISQKERYAQNILYLYLFAYCVLSFIFVFRIMK